MPYSNIDEIISRFEILGALSNSIPGSGLVNWDLATNTLFSMEWSRGTNSFVDHFLVGNYSEQLTNPQIRVLDSPLNIVSLYAECPIYILGASRIVGVFSEPRDEKVPYLRFYVRSTQATAGGPPCYAVDFNGRLQSVGPMICRFWTRAVLSHSVGIETGQIHREDPSTGLPYRMNVFYHRNWPGTRMVEMENGTTSEIRWEHIASGSIFSSLVEYHSARMFYSVIDRTTD